MTIVSSIVSRLVNPILVIRNTSLDDKRYMCVSTVNIQYSFIECDIWHTHYNTTETNDLVFVWATSFQNWNTQISSNHNDTHWPPKRTTVLWGYHVCSSFFECEILNSFGLFMFQEHDKRSIKRSAQSEKSYQLPEYTSIAYYIEFFCWLFYRNYMKKNHNDDHHDTIQIFFFLHSARLPWKEIYPKRNRMQILIQNYIMLLIKVNTEKNKKEMGKMRWQMHFVFMYVQIWISYEFHFTFGFLFSLYPLSGQIKETYTHTNWLSIDQPNLQQRKHHAFYSFSISFFIQFVISCFRLVLNK